ncbi:hypothetical protein KFL_000690360 [Klebsormidium nitens]|uniref:Fungal lipase-type domain-containing protein n=1 Tax=Klebsormidium nitens TaxID=105231 RepID=A0A1Y1HYW8_KLENI|nr:hypothetical protein KFL_000690360 [Klebsormidium nitens]|eukprot:GAQ81058.1 hypothetical protein KFL_000690360 [Klebsormidium nitens]
MACSSVAPCALAPTLFSLGPALATRAGPANLRAPTLLRGTPFFGGKLSQSAEGSKIRRSRPAPIARAQAVSTSAPKTVVKGDSDDDDPKWLELHGKSNWAGLLPIKGENGDPGTLDPDLKKTIIKYGEMAQLTYDSVDLYEWSRYRSQNRYTKKVGKDLVPSNLFGENLKVPSYFEHLPGEGYEAVAYMYASEKTKVIRAVKADKGQDMQEDVWIGYIAYSKTKRDIVVGWRGTQQPAEWVADAEVGLIPYKKFVAPTVGKKDLAGSTDLAGDKGSTEDKDSPPLGDALTYLSKAGYGALAFVGATFLGGVSAGIIAGFFYIFAKLVESESLLGSLLNAAFGAVAALPISKFGPKLLPDLFQFWPELEKGKVGGFVTSYAIAVGVLTAFLNLVNPGDQFWTVDKLIFIIAVLLPTGATAAAEAWESAGDVPQVHEGFFELYDPTGDPNKAPKLPKAKETQGKFPRKVIHETIPQLLSEYPEARTISVTGHSLGGALAVLSAYDIVESGYNLRPDGVTRVPVACFAFEAPRVGNPRFKASFAANKKNELAAIRVVNKPDIVTQVPKAFYLQNVYYILAAITNNDIVVDIINWVEGIGYGWGLPSAFEHVAPEQELVHDSREVDYLKKMTSWNPLDNKDAIGYYHNLEVNLHMVSGYWSDTFSRDFALCNKSADVIDPRAGVPPEWFKTLIPYVVRADPGTALIEPYSDELPPTEGEDNERLIGQGPVAGRGPTPGKCMPLKRNYFEQYLKGYTPPAKNELWEALKEKWEDFKAGSAQR